MDSLLCVTESICRHDGIAQAKVIYLTGATSVSNDHQASCAHSEDELWNKTPDKFAKVLCMRSSQAAAVPALVNEVNDVPSRLTTGKSKVRP